MLTFLSTQKSKASDKHALHLMKSMDNCQQAPYDAQCSYLRVSETKEV